MALREPVVMVVSVARMSSPITDGTGYDAGTWGRRCSIRGASSLLFRRKILIAGRH